MSKNNTEPLLSSDDNRFVTFPIKYEDIWDMYKKQVDCFWRAEEIDLTKDLANWETLEQGEKYFVAKIQYDLPDENSGKIKKIREEKLVKGFSVTDVEAKVTKKYEGFTHDWRITAVSESKIDEVIE